MKQFNLEQKAFADLEIGEDGEPKTSGDGWVHVKTQEEINTISAAITSGKEVWLDGKGVLQFSPPPPSELHRWNGKAWALDKAAEAAVKAEQQAEMWERIKAKRAQSCHAGIYINSIKKWMHSDADSRQQYTFLRTLDKLPENLMWKTVDNSFVPMTRALLDELSLKLITDEQHDFQNAERHKAAMLKAANPLEYDYSEGWSAAELMDKEVQHG